MSEFACERLGPALLLELIPLITAHWNELNPAATIPFNPDVKTYLECEAAGILRIFTARKEGRLVGYSCFYVRQGIHCRDVKMASHDALFVEKSNRGMLAARFIIWCDQELEREGVRTIAQNSRLDHPIDSVLKRLGYRATETVFVRDLDHASRITEEGTHD